MLTAHATVTTPTPDRYGRQLADHFARKVTVEDVPGGHVAHLAGGHAEILVRPDALLLRAHGPDAQTLAAVQGVVGGHLERFGRRQGLAVVWEVATEPPDF